MTPALVLAWKYNNAPGIRTRELPDGSFEIFDWPAELGPEPTQTQIDQWTVDYETQGIRQEIDANAEADLALAKVVRDLAFDHENRIRTLEGKPAVTKQQVTDQLKSLFKNYL